MPDCLTRDSDSNRETVQQTYCAQVRPSTQGLVAHGWQLLHDQADVVHMDYHLPLRGLGLVHPQGFRHRRLGRQRLTCTKWPLNSALSAKWLQQGCQLQQAPQPMFADCNVTDSPDLSMVLMAHGS